MTDPSGASARIHINLSSGELDIQGNEEFVSQYSDSIEGLLDRLQTERLPAARVTQVPASSTSPTANSNNRLSSEGGLEPFGEVLHSLGSKTGTDQILLAGYYASEASNDGTFATVEANKLLMEQGIKLSNASQSLKNLLTAKRVFKVGSRYKVAKSGIDYLKALGVQHD